MCIYFISDLHLDEQQPKIVALFIEFLSKQAPKADALYILGDLFEAWVGDDSSSGLINQVKAALQQLTQRGIPTYFMHGNRDFLLGKQFAKETGIELLSDPTVIDLYGKSALLMHGDTLCTEDHSYLRFRKLVRHPLFQWAFLKLPLSYRQYIANNAREKSKAYTTKAEKIIMDVTTSEVHRVLREKQCQILIHGHTHRPSLSQFQLDEQWLQHIVLSDWHQHGNVLSCDSQHQFRLLNFTSN